LEDTLLRLAITLLTVLTALGVAAQNPTPGLQQRAPGAPEDQHVTVVQEAGKTVPVLPEDASGLYRFSEDKSQRAGNFGEGIQIAEQFGEVSGYVTISADSGHGKMATYFLSRVSGGNGHLSFDTRQVHGAWYSFDGNLFRGSGATTADEGYYLLSGTLTFHDEGKKSEQPRKITLKLTAQR
jgi:hypothetical protein